ncbi:MAG TPA: AAA family ATPase [Usitatibacter sp.]|nr:AAA family ATPase [Usitatibacter sp.]
MPSTLRAGVAPEASAVQPGTGDLIAALKDPACYPHPVGAVEVLETHISWVVLAGDFAYKVKKPVRLGFLDFGTLEWRRFYCEEELRLNRRTAPGLYLGVVPIAGKPPRVRVGGKGSAIEYAVHMRRFAQDDLLARRARERTLGNAEIDAIAIALARFHAGLPPASADCAFGSPQAIATAMLENFADIGARDGTAPVREAIAELEAWARMQHPLLHAVFARRKRAGFVRECHGDLHLGNIVLHEGAPVFFDALEFSERLRWGDVMNDTAFTAMDLVEHELPRLAARFVDRYLAESGDYGGLAVLRYYMVYRALVRAKVAAIRAQQPSADGVSGQECLAYASLALRLARRPPPLLVLMHGVSCSGKTLVSQRLLEALGAVSIRTDVERKRLRGVPAREHLGAPPDSGPYGAGEVAAVYAHVARLAAACIDAGQPAIVDATFLRRAQRDAFVALAHAAGATVEIVECTCSPDILRARALLRARDNPDASDAGIEVLESQLAHVEPLAAEERLHATRVDTTHPGEWQATVESLARRLRAKLP